MPHVTPPHVCTVVPAAAHHAQTFNCSVAFAPFPSACCRISRFPRHNRQRSGIFRPQQHTRSGSLAAGAASSSASAAAAIIFTTIITLRRRRPWTSTSPPLHTPYPLLHAMPVFWDRYTPSVARFKNRFWLVLGVAFDF
jgi:hypothetical protein